MSSSTLFEVFGHVLFSFTRSVTDHYNPDEPEYTAESFGYNPLQSTGREWYYHPVDEFIYQEYSDREVRTSFNYLAASSLSVKVTDACSTEEKNEETLTKQQINDAATAWKRLRPSLCCTIWKSMYIGALISLLTAIILGVIYTVVLYLSFKTINICEFYPTKLIPLRVQWIRTVSSSIADVMLDVWFFINVLFLFRQYQLKGVKRKLFLPCCVAYLFDVAYRVILQALKMSNYSKLSYLLRIPLNVVFFINIGVQAYFLTKLFCQSRSSKRKMSLFLQLTLPVYLTFLLGIIIARCIYPVYNKQNREGKLLIAVFAPLIAVLVKPISRICVQRLYNIIYPGYSYVLLTPLYCGAAVLFRVLQADLGSLQSIATLGIIHGIAEVIERSSMVVIDHLLNRLWKLRTPAPWGSFRTPRRERLMADIAIMSMQNESAAIVSVNGILYLYQFFYTENNADVNLLQSFAINTSVPLIIEWFFNSLSLAIETRYQNMPVMAIWIRQWKRHILVATFNTVLIALWTSTNILEVINQNERFVSQASLNQTCKIPFT